MGGDGRWVMGDGWVDGGWVMDIWVVISNRMELWIINGCVGDNGRSEQMYLRDG